MLNSPPNKHPISLQRRRALAEEETAQLGDVAIAAVPSTAPCDSSFAIPPPTAVGSSRKCTQSTASLVARRKHLELKAAEAIAQIDKELIDKRLAADLAAIDAEFERHSDVLSHSDGQQQHLKERQSDVLSHSKTQDHIYNSLEDNQRVNMSPSPVPPEPVAQSSDRAAAAQARDNTLHLAHAITNKMDQSSSHLEERLLSRLATPRDLPVFSGDVVKRLHFKTAHDESTSTCSYSDSENISRLRRDPRGDAKEAITDLLIEDTPPAAVMTCSYEARDIFWYQHVVALALDRIRNADSVQLRVPISETILQMDRQQLEKFVQCLTAEHHTEKLPTAQRLPNEVLQNRSAINRIRGAPDSSVGPPPDAQHAWYLNDQQVREQVRTYLLQRTYYNEKWSAMEVCPTEDPDYTSFPLYARVRERNEEDRDRDRRDWDKERHRDREKLREREKRDREIRRERQSREMQSHSESSDEEPSSLREGDNVVLVDPNLECGSWCHGVVSVAHATRDGCVRIVDVRTRSGPLRRPVTRVALLSYGVS